MRAVKAPGLRWTLSLSAVALQLAAAWLLKLAAERDPKALLPIVALLGGVLALHALRLMAFLWLYRRDRIASVQRLSALFFPAAALLAWTLGETLDWPQVGGALLVTAGVMLGERNDTSEDMR